MNCPKCEGLSKKDGKDPNGEQRFKCTACGKRFTLPRNKLLGAMTLPEPKALMCLDLLVEGNSIRSTERITGVHRDTILRLLETVSKKCLWVQESLVKNIKVTDVQANEISAFVGVKQKIANKQGLDGDERVGNAYAFTAIESHSKLVVAWHLGRRTGKDALVFLDKLYNAIYGATNRFQMSTDAFRSCEHRVNEILGTKVDYGQVTENYGNPNPDEVRCSAGDVIKTKKRVVCADPDLDTTSTIYVERSNLTVQMSMRRLTKLTTDSSKKWENLNHALALYFAFYNFCRVHKALRCTPAMEARITKTVWTLKDFLDTAPQD